VGWLAFIAFGAAGLGSMRAAVDRGDLDEAARQGMLAGAATIEKALAAPDRPARLAGIAAAPSADDREELLQPLAVLAGNPDRRTAIGAANAARQIARELAKRSDPPDDIAVEDLATWRDRWATLARDGDRWIELRVIALDTAAALDRTGIGVDLATSLADPDPAFRRAAVAIVPMPVPPALRGPLAAAVVKDTDAGVALAAAAALCADLATDPPKPVLDALGTPGLDRIRSLVAGHGSATAIRDVKRCLKP
jgi:hypothetical protein